MDTSECDWVEEFLGGLEGPPEAALERAAAVGPAARAAAHLEGCAACRAFARELSEVDALLASEPTPLPPPELGREILAALAERRRAELRWARGRGLALSGLVAASAALVALIGPFEPLEGGLSSDPIGLLSGWAQVGLADARLQLEAASAGLTPALDRAGELGWGPLFGLLPLWLICNWAIGRSSLTEELA